MTKLQFKIQNFSKHLIAIFGFWILVFGFSLVAFATSERDIVFPIPELGDCANKAECKAYCNNPDHIKACVAFAKKHNLLSEKEVKRAETVVDLPPGGGPGKCSTLEQCASYCATIDHIQECLAFGKKHGLMEQSELEEAQKVEKALREGAKLPGGCTSKEQCEAYCEEEGHMDECIGFGRKAGFMSEEEYQIAKKTGGRGPGGCRGKEQCEDYCHGEEHFQECINFAKEHGLIGEKEAQIALKTGGRGPGGCREKEACQAYCEDESHFEDCLTFGKEHGFISEKEYEMAKKTGGKGPGGCKGEECEEYCEDPEHVQECMNFAKEHGLMSEEEMRQMEEGKHKFMEMLNQAPSEVVVCVQETLGQDLFTKMKKGEMLPGPGIGERIRACFERFRPQEGSLPLFPAEVPEEMEMDLLSPLPTKREEICIQVITPGRDPQTGVCYEFPTPCDVPAHWEKVERCEVPEEIEDFQEYQSDVLPDHLPPFNEGGKEQDYFPSLLIPVQYGKPQSQSLLQKLGANLLSAFYFLSNR